MKGCDEERLHSEDRAASQHPNVTFAFAASLMTHLLSVSSLTCGTGVKSTEQPMVGAFVGRFWMLSMECLTGASQPNREETVTIRDRETEAALLSVTVRVEFESSSCGSQTCQGTLEGCEWVCGRLSQDRVEELWALVSPCWCTSMSRNQVSAEGGATKSR